MSSGKKKSKNKNNSKNNRSSNNSYRNTGSKTAVSKPAGKSKKVRRAGNAQHAGTASTVGRTEILAVVPGMMLCLMMLIMLIADLGAEDPQGQYELFPAVFRVTNYISVAAGALFIGVTAADRDRRSELAHKLKTEKTWIFFAVFLLCIIISTCINGLTEGALHGLPYRNIGVFSMAAFIIIYMGVSSGVQSEKLSWIFLVTLQAAADLIALSALYDMYIGMIPAYHAKKELSTIFFNGNHYGYFLTMAVLAGLGAVIYTDGWQLMLGAVTALLNGGLLIVNHSLGCIIAVLAVAVVTAVSALINEPARRKRLLITIGAAVALAVLAFIISPEIRKEFSNFGRDIASIIAGNASGSEGHNRIRVWTRTWSYILEKPMFGFGCEGMSERLYIGTGISNPHNEILTYAAYYGIPAAVAYTGGIMALFVRYFRCRNSACYVQKTAGMAAAGYFISSFTGVSMFYITPLFFVLLGIMVSKSKKNNV